MAESPRSAPEPAPFRRTAAALQHRDRGCRLPGMRALIRQGITSAMGRTADDNAVEPGTAVSAAPRAVHERDRVDRYPDGDLCFRRPGRAAITGKSRKAPGPRLPSTRCGAARRRRAFTFTREPRCRLLGERLDVGYASTSCIRCRRASVPPSNSKRPSRAEPPDGRRATRAGARIVVTVI